MPKRIAKIQYASNRLARGTVEDWGWFISINGEYLHSDGIVRESTRNLKTNKHTGYFTTFGEASYILNGYSEIIW